MIDNYIIDDIDLSDLRKNIGYVSQNTFLFADTIKNNLYMVAINTKVMKISLKLVN